MNGQRLQSINMVCSIGIGMFHYNKTTKKKLRNGLGIELA
jgi:hypothetical protein